MSWQTLQDEAGELAAFGARRLTDSRVAYLATVDDSGAPRLHPVTPIVAPGGLFVFMEATSPKGHDLERGSRYALHCAVEDDEGGDGEFRIRGSARRVVDAEQRALVAEHAPYTPTDDYVLFELLVDDAFSTVYAEGGTPERRRWRVSPAR
jgi:hypothetical protein